MFHRLVTATFLTFAAMPAAAQCVGESYLKQLPASEQAALAAVAADTPYGAGTLWTATKDDQQVTVVGTMHIHDPRLEPIRERIKDTVQSADLVMLEATKEDQEKLQLLLSTDPEILLITDGPTLPDLLEAEVWDTIVEATTSRGIPGILASKMQPWYLSLLLSVPPCAFQDMMTGRLGLDHMIIEDAEAAGVEMQALESVLTLFEIFEKAPMEEQIDMLRVNLLPAEVQQQMFVSMLDSYFSGDIATLWEMSRVVMENTPGVDTQAAQDAFESFETSLLIDRNRNWMPIIKEATEQHDDIVVAVGAAHLIGEEGILQFLQNEGWTLSEIDQTSP